MEPRAVSAGHGWAWIVQGYLLFRKSPVIWLSLLLLLFFTTKVLLSVPLAGMVFMLLMPLFIAGLMEGCRALERGQPLEPSHLFAGFRRNAAPLVTIGGISLVSNIGIMMIVMGVGGEAMAALGKTIAQGSQVAPQLSKAEMQAAAQVVTRALLVGSIVSLPLVMAMWYAPLLVYFNDLGPVAAMKSSFFACLKNLGAMLVYGAVIFAGMFVAMPFSIALGQYDLALLLLAPIVLPSVYASYKDIFPAGTAPQPNTDSVAG
jgi:uncharacterized membrane protein